MTEKQQSVLRRFRAFADEEGRQPTLTEMAREFRVAKATMHGHFIGLLKRGMLKHTGSGRNGRWLLAERCVHCGQTLRGGGAGNGDRGG